MCYYAGCRVTKDSYLVLKDIEKQFGYLIAENYLYNGFNYGDIPVILPDCTDIKIEYMHWEFIPPFVKDEAELKLYRQGINPKTGEKKDPIPWLNAKSENLLLNSSGKKAMWADAARSRRCLIPVTHFFESRYYEKKKYPYYIGIGAEHQIHCFAAIWQSWNDKSTGEVINTVAIVTTEAGEVLSAIHNLKKRQPTILNADLAYRWLFDDLKDDEITSIAKYQLPDENFIPYTISKDFRSSGNPMEPFNYPELPMLDIAV